MPFPEIDPVLVSLGPLHIRWYALAYIAGIVLGLWYLTKLVAKPALWQAKGGGGSATPPISKEGLDDILVYAVLGIILGGRLGFVFFYQPSLLATPFGEWPVVLGFLPVPQFLAIWEGGMSFHGGLIGVVLAILIYARRNGADAIAIGDLFACAAPIGLFFGRIANFINAELYGRPWDGPWSVTFPDYFDRTVGQWIYAADAVARHPSQLYEAVLEGALLFAIIYLLVHKQHLLRIKGAAIAIFLGGYGAARFFVEFFRQPDVYDFAAPIGFLTRGMMLSLPMVFLGAWLLWWAVKQTKTAEASKA